MINECSAWNPGLELDLPPAFCKLETIYRPENVTTRFEDINEIATQTGLSPMELVAFRPERLALHELIVRVTADILVLEGDDEMELGVNFRRICKRILAGYIVPRMAEIKRMHGDLHRTVYGRVEQELTATLFISSIPETVDKGFFPFLRRKKKQTAAQQGETILERERRAIASFHEKELTVTDPLNNAIYKSLHRVLGS